MHKCCFSQYFWKCTYDLQAARCSTVSCIWCNWWVLSNPCLSCLKYPLNIYHKHVFIHTFNQYLQIIIAIKMVWCNRKWFVPYRRVRNTYCESLISLISDEWCERIAHFAHQKWATMRDSLKSLRGNERCERITHFAHQKWANEWIATLERPSTVQCESVS